jgi:hypothetical protein
MVGLGDRCILLAEGCVQERKRWDDGSIYIHLFLGLQLSCGFIGVFKSSA